MTLNFTSLQNKMKRNLIKGIILIGAVALSSCSVNKTAFTSKNDDDVYFSHASAAEEPVYITRNEEYNQDTDDQYSDEDDYFYYDDYASRINRFSYYSPFGYYDNLYYGYSPYGYGYGGFGIGLGFGYGYSPYSYWGLGGGFGYPWGYGYGNFGYGAPWGGYGYGYPWGGYGYSPYSYWGTGYGGSGYWGVYSAYNRGNARPYRGNGSPGSSFGNTHRTAYGDRNTGIGYIPNRGSRGGNSGQTSGRPVYGDTRATRGVRNDVPTYQPSVDRSSPSSNSSGGGRSSGGGSSSGSSGGGGGGGRPVRN